RFLDQKGAVIPPTNGPDVGELRAEEEARLALHGLPREHQIGYLRHHAGQTRETIAEVIVTPIVSTETHEAIAALAIGFKPVAPAGQRGEPGIRSGIWLEGRLHLPSLAPESESLLGAQVAGALATPGSVDRGILVRVDGVAHRLFYQRLNPDSLFPAAYEVGIYPLTALLASQRQLRWSILGAGALMLLGGLGASHVFSRRLSVPVQKLAVDSEQNRVRRARAEAALELSNEGLQRAVRFSADASHQLKTPVTVLRAGLEELLAREQLGPDVRDELAELVHQSYRLTSVIDDLLLLSRADAGRLQINLAPVDLARLIEAGVDDLGTIPDALGIAIETDFPTPLRIDGDNRYSAIIVQNLLENARKYNQPRGRIAITARERDTQVFLTIGNTGRPIPESDHEHIFERFHRGSVGENVPGHGLGLNLARELARLHGGDLRLVRSEGNWTEFEARFRTAPPAAADPRSA
ncbi:MAG: HAMP domain-containing histidine kinase, partial [Verrucomicrobia bacterium]